MAIASDRTGTPKRRHGIADSMPAFAYHAMRPQRTRIASRCDRLGTSQVDRRAIWPIPHHQTNPTAPRCDMAVAPRADTLMVAPFAPAIPQPCNQAVASHGDTATGRPPRPRIHPPCDQTITLQPDTAPATLPQQRKTVCRRREISQRRQTVVNNG